jgi:hypothetical protein
MLRYYINSDQEHSERKRTIKQILENPRREVGLKRNNIKVIDTSRRRSRAQSTGNFSINRQLPSSFVHTFLENLQV